MKDIHEVLRRKQAKYAQLARMINEARMTRKRVMPTQAE